MSLSNSEYHPEPDRRVYLPAEPESLESIVISGNDQIKHGLYVALTKVLETEGRTPPVSTAPLKVETIEGYQGGRD
jgi:hypothetical protein